MLIVAIAQTKGGSGKSTIAQNIAVEAARDGKQVLLVDLDPAQSAAKWWRRRGGPSNPMLESSVRSLVTYMDVMQGKSDQPDLMVMDTPGELLNIIRAAVSYAHVIVIPLQPSIKDWESVPDVEDIVIRAGKRAQSLYVLNRFRSSTEASIQVKSALHKHTGVVPLTMALATDHERADAQGQTGAEISNKIAGEVGILWEEIKRIGRTNEQSESIRTA